MGQNQKSKSVFIRVHLWFKTVSENAREMNFKTTLVLIVLLVGWSLPVTHTATAEATFKSSPESLYQVITDVDRFPQWRSSVKSVERLPDSVEAVHLHHQMDESRVAHGHRRRPGRRGPPAEP